MTQLLPPAPKFPDQVYTDFEAHAVACFPQEACGLVVDDTFVPCKNAAADPVRNFKIARREQLAATKGRTLQAVLHTHVPRPGENGETMPALNHPSQADLVGQIASAVPWGVSVASATGCTVPLFWGDQLPIGDLLGRSYILGVWDCFTLVRDYYRLRGVTIAPMVDQYDAWTRGEDTYLLHFEQHGFRRIEAREVQPGDAFLMSLRSEVLNHAGIYAGEGLILHHLGFRLSARVVAGPWMNSIGFWLRHESGDA